MAPCLSRRPIAVRLLNIHVLSTIGADTTGTLIDTDGGRDGRAPPVASSHQGVGSADRRSAFNRAGSTTYAGRNFAGEFDVCGFATPPPDSLRFTAEWASAPTFSTSPATSSNTSEHERTPGRAVGRRPDLFARQCRSNGRFGDVSLPFARRTAEPRSLRSRLLSPLRDG